MSNLNLKIPVTNRFEKVMINMREENISQELELKNIEEIEN